MYRILDTHSATLPQVTERLQTSGRNIHTRFYLEMLPALWTAATEYAIDGVGMVAQAGKETAWGNFGGAVTPQFYNTAGIKIRHLGFMPGVNDLDRPLAHAQFANWEVGAAAHAQHLRAYCGAPVVGLIVDPRYIYALRTPATAAETWISLGGKWAPSPTYGAEIEAIMNTLILP